MHLLYYYYTIFNIQIIFSFKESTTTMVMMTSWTALEDRTFSPLLQCCLTVPYSYSGP